METRKKNVSVRLSCTDIQKIKDLSATLGVRESDLVRASIKRLIDKLNPLNDGSRNGCDLIPVWLDCGDLLDEQFDLDVEQLDQIFNDSVTDEGNIVDPEDLKLIAMAKRNPIYLVKKLSHECGRPVDPLKATAVLRAYLYEKYVLGKICDCKEDRSGDAFNRDMFLTEYSVN